MIETRRATVADGPFLQQMLAIAVDWRPGTPVRPVAEIMQVPELARYVAGWPNADDFGLVAVDRAAAVGAAWWRRFSGRHPGYGFVDERTPELSIGVVETVRRRGIGTLLLRALIDEAERMALPALSLSVESDNPAASLYERLGFAPFHRDGGSITMVRPLGAF